LVQQVPQSETAPFYLRFPYVVAQLYAYWIRVTYGETYNMNSCNGILFNHEFPQRGQTFVNRKITSAMAKIALGMDDCLYLGNLNMKGAWGHSKDYVESIYLIL
jgi:GDPmannose 4,6-dehydratase